MGKFTISCTLSQQTPLIHFQHQEPGACLRGSELKPKLDRFLLEQLGQGNALPQDAGYSIARENGWLAGDGSHPALKYKVRISVEETAPQHITKSNEIAVKVASITGAQNPIRQIKEGVPNSVEFGRRQRREGLIYLSCKTKKSDEEKGAVANERIPEGTGFGQGHHRGIGRRIAGGTGKRRAAVAFYSGRA